MSAVCAETDAAADRLAASVDLMAIRRAHGQFLPIASVEEALAYPYSYEERAFLEDFRTKIFVGSPRTVRARLEQLAAETRADELMVSTVVHEHAARKRSYELLAEAFGLEQGAWPQAASPPRRLHAAGPGISVHRAGSHSGQERSLLPKYLLHSTMAQKYSGTFSRRGPDVVAEELALALCGKAASEFKPLFNVVHTSLRARNAASGGEEMLRLRVYEKLQSMVSRGMVSKVMTRGVKEYLGLASLASALPLAPLTPEAAALAALPLAPLTPAVVV